MHVTWSRWPRASLPAPAGWPGGAEAWRPVPATVLPGPMAGMRRPGVRRRSRSVVRGAAFGARVALAVGGVLAAAWTLSGIRSAAPTVAGPVTAASWQAFAPAEPALPGGPAAAPLSSVSAQALQSALAAAAAAHADQPPPRPAWWTPVIGAAAQKTGLPASLLAAVVQVESQGNPHAVSPAGAKGLMQLLPTTAAALGVRDIFDPVDNAVGGARYLAQWLKVYGHDDTACITDPAACPEALRLALAAYNAGPNAVRRYGGVPPYPETQRYLEEVLRLYNAYRADSGG